MRRRKRPKHPHAVLIVLDEFPGDTLLGPDGRIDAGRFPNFAALAGDATWFHNAHTAYDSTTKAVPLVLDGIRPHPGTSPIVRDHPHSIFTALGRRGYRIVTSEEATAHVPGALLPERAQAAAGDHPEPQGRPRRALRRVHPLDPREPAAHVLDEARAAAARAVGLPAVGRSHRGPTGRSSCLGCRRCRASTTTT